MSLDLLVRLLVMEEEFCIIVECCIKSDHAQCSSGVRMWSNESPGGNSVY